MSFGEAVSSGFHNYATFDGRAVRSAYWYWELFIVLVAIVAAVIDAVLGTYPRTKRLRPGSGLARPRLPLPRRWPVQLVQNR